ncbi:MAG: 5-deoxy-glucuronate isomerase [Myxococcales bacterium]|nr:5-deoxy-glucuronate isomerase [Myxococcales bacterium]
MAGPIIRAPQGGFQFARTEITDLATAGFGLGFEVLHLPAGAQEALRPEHETAWLLMQGSLRIRGEGLEAACARSDLFDALPWTLHAPAGSAFELVADSAVELLEFKVANSGTFTPRLLGPESVRNERRGEGALHDGAFRFVRTIIDDVAGPPEAKLVLGEVVNLPGRWSSYPPHHHPQPELYHYRFTAPQGYGHAEMGEAVHRVRHGDTLLIQPGHDHAQCAAPGYGMWYAWAIRHLERQRYSVPEFAPEHAWILAEGAKEWWPHE